MRSYEDGVYYMIGEEKSEGSNFQAVNCYSSTNLVDWDFVGNLISRDDSEPDLGPNRIIERPKVLKNEQTGKYVLFMHVDSSDYKDARVGWGTGDTICGEYTYLGSSRPLDKQIRDIGVFKDEDGTAYLLTEDREYGTRIMRLSEDYLSVEEITMEWQYFAESPAMVKRGGTYYIFGSHLTGWNPNDNVYSAAQNLSGPWTEWTEFAPVGTNTYSSQVSFILPLSDDKAIYMGDRWFPDNLGASEYIWLPLQIDGDTVRLDWYDNWSVHMEAGTWQSGLPYTEYEAEAAELSNEARLLDCGECSGSQMVGYIGGDQDGTVSFDVEAACDGDVTMVLKYRNGDEVTTSTFGARNALVSVGGVEQTVDFPSTRHKGGQTAKSVVQTAVKKGSNIVTVSGADSWGPDLDVLLVPGLSCSA
ncbi:glycosyl hydrolase family 43 protein [Emericellopsis atlantica]|uniref:Glycosyl hydrolase family 43 protein n=1 Tax=Emericellopsis atlantica TaxID=2614577 RepID=A0A9P8CNW1_9HYPO|nr:glycosyl hydrolase family 43 protein [Emericellopsis atlantica]KAG9253918.1 glycosyl hydrolase family 43 protein [Emericellopsis atlantica]